MPHIEVNTRYEEFEKRYFLGSVIDDKYHCAQIADRPDLQSKKGEYGVEITSADDSDHHEINSLKGKYFGAETPEKAKEYAQKLESSKYTVEGRAIYNHHVNGDYIVLTVSKQKKILDCISKKEEKLNSGYAIFRSNELYVYTESFMHPPFKTWVDSIKQFVKEVCRIAKQSDRQYHFNRIFVECIDGLLDIEVNTGHFVWHQDDFSQPTLAEEANELYNSSLIKE